MFIIRSNTQNKLRNTIKNISKCIHKENVYLEN